MVPRLVILASAIAGAAATLEVAAGRALFDRPWVLAPASQHAQAGLGPLYDARACASCHGGGGPGRIAVGGGLVVRLGDSHGAPDPIYGEQLQTRAAPGLAPEAAVRLSRRGETGLRANAVEVAALGYGPFGAATRMSLRRAPSLVGVGLLERVPDREILSRVHAADHDGVSGRAALLADGRLGRWGWKAAQPTLDAQVAAALARDMGVSTAARPHAWGDCTAAQAACRAMAVAGTPSGPEAIDAGGRLIVAYLRALNPPAPNASSAAGAALFARAGCGACHATLSTSKGAPVRAYTDLLLHDMGPGLDDGVGEGAAAPSEWRTAPLWSLRAELEAGGLLHDGRARSVAEAVAWHGGEAARARKRFQALGPRDRAAIETFLLSR